VTGHPRGGANAILLERWLGVDARHKAGMTMAGIVGIVPRKYKNNHVHK
jgi:hypothetical protein